MMTERSSYETAATWLYQNAPTPPIHSLFTPVPIFHNRIARGIGTLWQRKDANCIITATHIFSRELDYGFWTYRIPHDDAPRMYPIENAQPIKSVHGYEVTLCSLPQMIYSPYFKGFIDYDMNAALADMFSRSQSSNERCDKRFTSLATGISYTCAATQLLHNGETVFIINKSGTTPGESGTGFIDKESKLYVLSFGLNHTSDPTIGSAYSGLFPVPEFNLQKK